MTISIHISIANMLNSHARIQKAFSEGAQLSSVFRVVFFFLVDEVREDLITTKSGQSSVCQRHATLFAFCRRADDGATLNGVLLWLLSGPLGFTCWISFVSGIQFYLLLSSYLCFISFLYLDFYVLGDDALIS